VSLRHTERLYLRRWRDTDLEPFAELNADREVMRYFPRPLRRAESDALVEKIESHFDDTGFGLWAVDVANESDQDDVRGFIGFVGLLTVPFRARFTPAVEVGWRLRRSAWGKGYATEAATEALREGFEGVGLDEIVSFTSTVNLASQSVMRRIGMTNDPADNFDHPSMNKGHALEPHVLYRVRSQA